MVRRREAGPRRGARGTPASAIAIAAISPISSAWRRHGATAGCAYPMRARRMATRGSAAARAERGEARPSSLSPVIGRVRGEDVPLLGLRDRENSALDFRLD